MSHSLQDRDIFRCRPPLRLRSHQGETGGEEEEEEGGRELESRSDPRSSRETTSRSKGAILEGSERVKVFLRCCEVSRASRVDVVDGREEERGRRSRESSTFLDLPPNKPSKLTRAESIEPNSSLSWESARNREKSFPLFPNFLSGSAKRGRRTSMSFATLGSRLVFLDFSGRKKKRARSKSVSTRDGRETFED